MPLVPTHELGHHAWLLNWPAMNPYEMGLLQLLKSPIGVLVHFCVGERERRCGETDRRIGIQNESVALEQ